MFNTPNPNSLPGYLKMGWQVVGRSRSGSASVRPGSARRMEAPPQIGDGRRALGAPGRLGPDRRRGPPGRGARSPRSSSAPRSPAGGTRRRGASTTCAGDTGPRPLLGYHVVVEERAGEPGRSRVLPAPRRGLALGSVSSVTLIVRPGDVGRPRNLLRSVRRAGRRGVRRGVLPREGPRRPRARRGPDDRSRAPRGMTLRREPAPIRTWIPIPWRLSSWALSTGDVEVF